MRPSRKGTLAAVAVLLLILPALDWSPGARGLPAPAGGESEPNDTPESADPLIPGDDVAGTIGVEGDEDWFVLNLDGPAELTLDVDAAVLGSPLDPLLRICDPAGCADVPEGQSYGIGPYGAAVGDSWRRVYVPKGGRYTVGIRSQDGQAGPNHTYVLKSSLAPPPPAEPMACLAPVDHGGQRAAAAGFGHLYYVTTEGQYHGMWSIRRRTPGGGDTKYYQTPLVPHENLTPRYRTTHAIGDLAVDAFGDLVVTEPFLGPEGVSYLSVIRDGVRHEVLDSARAFEELAIDADGDIWVSLDPDIREYSRRGEVLSEFDPGVPVDALTFHPDGTLYLISEGSLLRRASG
ncbi:MAG: hypothetical protein KY466_03825, partial [Gemmatimonadetes bacterium]|nr:hypothetical protein [Gemmatimonadota bacterium]